MRVFQLKQKAALNRPKIALFNSSAAIVAAILVALFAFSACANVGSAQTKQDYSPTGSVPANRNRQGDGGTSTADGLPIPADRVQASKGGTVTVQVIWPKEQPNADQLSLSVALDTHSGSLDLDLSQLASVRNDKGTEFWPIAWNAPSGGHHLKGTLVFPLAAEGESLIEPDTKYVELVIRDVGGVEEMVLHWEMKLEGQ